MKKSDSNQASISTTSNELLEIQQLKALISSSFDAIIAIDQNKQIITFNRQAVDLLGYSESGMIGHSVVGLHDDKVKAKKIYRTIEHSGKIDRMDIVLIHKDGSKIPVSISGKLIVDGEGNKLGQVGFMKDLREVQLLETRLKALIETSKAVNSTSELKEILERVVRSALQAIPSADRGSIYFYTERSTKLDLMISSYDYSRKALEAMSFQVGEGLVGWVFEHQESVNCEDALNDARYKLIHHPEVKPHRAMLCVPITGRREIGVICLSHSEKVNTFSQADLDLLIGFADQAAIAIENAEQITRTKKEAEELDFLRSISLKINAQINIEEILTVILESGNNLLGTEMAVVHWMGRGKGKLKTFAAPRELHDLMTEPRMDNGLTAEVFRTGVPVVIPDTAQDKRVNPLVVNAGIQSLVGYPLKLQDQVVGTLFFNSQQRQHFNEHEIHLISLLLPLAAVAIENTNIIERFERNQHLSESLVEVGRKLTARQVLEEQLQALKKFMLEELAAPMFYLGMYNATNDEIQFLINWQEGEDREPFAIPLKDLKEWTISSFVVKKQSPITWFTKEQKKEECRLLGINPLVIGKGCQTCLAFPLEVEGIILGVISIQSQEPNAWDKIEASAFQTLANQASIAIRNAQLMQEVNKSLGSLQSTYQASEKIISELDPDKALDMLVGSICREFGAFRACAVLISEEGNPYHFSSSGFEGKIELSTAIRPEGYSISVYRSCKPEFLEDIELHAKSVHPKMTEQGVRAAAALPLIYQEDRLGVLWLHFDQPHHFLENEKDALRLFTNQAAIAYVNARLHQQVKDARDTAAQVAQMTALGDLQKTLNTIVKGIKSVLGCDIVTLYTYREEKDAFDLPPATEGNIRFPKKITGILEKHTAPYKIVYLDDIHVSDDSQHDPILGTPFAIRENVQSGVGVPLKVQDRRVGACFINYCHQKHAFTPEELVIIRLFASQAAVAIRNAILFEEEQKRRDVLRIIDEAGRTVTGSLKLDEIFSNLAEQACKLTGERGIMAKFASITVVEGEQIILKAAYPPEEMERITRAKAGNVDIGRQAGGKIGIVGRAVREKKPLLVPDVKSNPDYICSNKGTVCELAVPIIYQGEVLGVINVEHEEKGGLDKDDQQDINLLAAHAAVAIQNARMYQVLERKSRHQQAIYEASKIINASLERSEKELLDLLAEQMVTKIVPAGGAKNVLGAILMYDDEKDLLTLVSTCPEKAFGAHHVGEVRSLKHPANGQIGITGKSVLEKQPKRVGDVSRIDDYLNYHKNTRSELDMPILEGGKVLGVISLECAELNGFDKEAEDALCAFAELAAIAIQNTRRYRDLKEARATVGNITAVVWMGLVAGAWRHSIGNMATTISDLALLAETYMDTGASQQEIRDVFKQMRNVVADIQAIPMPPLYSEAGMEPVLICQLVRDRINQFKSKERYKIIDYGMEFNLDAGTLVRASPEWLRRILDILIDNSSVAMKERRIKKITITLSLLNEGVEILFTDTGCGIPVPLRSSLFNEPIKKQKGEKGSGIGLFLANTVIESFGGSLGIRSSGPDGTTMALWLPVYK